LSKIQSIAVVAADNEYLRKRIDEIAATEIISNKSTIYQVMMYCKWLFLTSTTGDLPTGIPFRINSFSWDGDLSDTLSITTGSDPVRLAIVSTSTQNH